MTTIYLVFNLLGWAIVISACTLMAFFAFVFIYGLLTIKKTENGQRNIIDLRGRYSPGFITLEPCKEHGAETENKESDQKTGTF